MTERADYIGGGDIAAVLGVDPWRSKWDIWAEHVHDPSWQPQEETLLMRVGTYMESFLADEYQRTTGNTVVHEQAEFQHRNYPFLMVHVDGIVSQTMEDEHIGLVEFKTASSVKAWEDGIPEHYQAQCFFALGLTGAKWCDVSVLLPRGDFRTIRLDADPALQDNIIKAAVAFWNDHVLTKRPPPMDASPAASRWLARMPGDDEDVLEAGADLEEIIDKLSTVRTALKGLTSSEELLENQAKAIIGEHQKAVGRGWHVTYKRTKAFPRTTWKDAAGEMATMLQMAGLGDSAKGAIDSHSEIVSNRPFVLKKEEAE